MNSLIGTPIYKYSRSGSGYKKYTIVSIRSGHDSFKFIIGIKGTHWRKENSKIEYIEVNIINNKIIKLPPQYFTNLIEFFISNEAPIGSSEKQFLYEKEEIKAKFPEYFL